MKRLNEKKRNDARRVAERYNKMSKDARMRLGPNELRSLGIRRTYDGAFEVDPAFFYDTWEESEINTTGISEWSSWSSSNSADDWSSSSSTYNSDSNDYGSSSNDSSYDYGSDNY